MATMVRCSLLYTCPYPDDIFRQSGPSKLHHGLRTIHASSSSAKLKFKDVLHLHASILNIFKQVSEAKKLLKLKEMCYLPSSREKTVMLINNGSRRTRRLLETKQNGIQITKCEGTNDAGQWQSVFENSVIHCISTPQKVAPLRYPAIAFVAANALVLTLPLEALAETCEAADSSFFQMPLLLAVALIGATVGGLVARQRKEEMKRLNDQLRQINTALRRQARIESYAPTLSYAPVSSKIQENEVIIDSRKHDLLLHLKSGKNFLRTQDPESACLQFKNALELAQRLNDPIEEKKAARGIGASLQRLGKYKEAIQYHSMVLSASERVGEDSGNTEAYGAIADCYTELGELDQAGNYYDKYIARLETD
ncbi:hypothetical protein GIB67_040782 [Kingdonia uniflora]|uniref:Chloroplast FLU-like protein n=1 Tax=Kingdonia uniflora TaxID=39325 RepID=A0A7J7P4B7_9MAGN|nr:hypothetical protein GIB67_040782 [Kingdonia uniflora]